MNRPTYNGSTVTTPEAAMLIQLLGAQTYRDLALTTDQMRAIQKLYGFVPEKPNKKPEAPVKPERADLDTLWKYEDAMKAYEKAVRSHEKWEDPIKLMQAGADHNALRHAQSDGLRVIAWLAQYVPAGEDPLKHVIQLAAEAGMDVSCEELEWANSDPTD